MKPEIAARNLAVIGTILLILAAGVRLFAAYIITIDERFQPYAYTQPERIPVQGQFVWSPQGDRVQISRGVTLVPGEGEEISWIGNTYTLDLKTLVVTNGMMTLQPTSPFRLVDGKLASESLVVSFADDFKPAHLTLTADGDKVAYVEPSERSQTGVDLVILGAANGKLQLLDDSVTLPAIGDLAWSLDGTHLAFVAPVDGVDQVYIYKLIYQRLTLLTTQGGRKSEPVFSNNGEMIAYVTHGEDVSSTGGAEATPDVLPRAISEAPSLTGWTDVFVANIDGTYLNPVTHSQQAEFNLHWSADGMIVFAAWSDVWQSVAELFAVAPQADPSIAADAPARIYPLVGVEQLTCEVDGWGKDEARVTGIVRNIGAQAVPVPLEIAADRTRLDVAVARSEHRVRREVLGVAAGEAQAFDWKIALPRGEQKVFLAATVELGDEFPLSAAACEVIPRFGFIPRLRWLTGSLILIALGMVLSLPYLRHQKNAWYWRAWMIYALLMVALMAMESAAIFGVL